jgi:uncharacterized protein DUF4394
MEGTMQTRSVLDSRPQPVLRLLRLAAVVAIAGLVGACADGVGTKPQPSTGRSIYAIDGFNRLIVFGVQSPGTLRRSVLISGVRPNEVIIGIDFRPADGRLYAVGDSHYVYQVDTLSGAATRIGTGVPFDSLVGIWFGLDFDPVEDRIRVHSDADRNLRLDPTTGTAAYDFPLAYALTDPNVGVNPSVVATAYTGSVSPPAATTDLYGIDSGLDVLVRIVAPNSGQLTTLGPLNAATTADVGFDIAGDDTTAYATLSTAAGASRLYTIDLATGGATLIGNIGYGFPVRGIAVRP